MAKPAVLTEKRFTNFVNYVSEELRTFNEHPFCEIDSLVLSWISYLHFKNCDEITISDEGLNIREIFKLEDFDYMLFEVWSRNETLALLSYVCASPRFRDITLHYYHEEFDHEVQKQFAAVVFKCKEDLHYVAFRGTDWTITGWEEDFRLSLDEPVASQLHSVAYLNSVAEKIKGDLIIGGHSKGGNLAVYSSSFCEKEVQDRILQIYTHDGPGFSKEELATEGFLNIKDRIVKSVPRFSVFGMLFEQETEFKIVKSREKGVMQHNPVSWEVIDGHFIEYDNVSRASHVLKSRVNQWINSLDDESKLTFINGLFDILDATGLTSFEEIGADLKTNVPIILSAIKNMDPELQKFMLRTIKGLVIISNNKDSEEDLKLLDDVDKDEPELYETFSVFL